MKLYSGLRKRLAKKKIGIRWNKLNQAILLKPGDLVSTCEAVNRRVQAVYPIYCKFKTTFNNKRWQDWNKITSFNHGKFLIDVDIYTTNGGSCSACHCCTFPLETREQIIEFWSEWPHEECTIAKMCVEGRGNELFTELGEPTELYEQIIIEERRKWNENIKNERGSQDISIRTDVNSVL